VGHPLRKDYEADAQQHCDSSLPIQFDNENGVAAGDILE
jgi:NADH-quinone oxidoreductase subunit C/D